MLTAFVELNPRSALAANWLDCLASVLALRDNNKKRSSAIVEQAGEWDRLNGSNNGVG